jgi:hypothetical protein
LINGFGAAAMVRNGSNSAFKRDRVKVCLQSENGSSA